LGEKLGVAEQSILDDLRRTRGEFPGCSVVSSAVEMNTARGWWNAPARFLPAERLMPVFPPTELSTIESSVVGTCRKSIPRR
jgi:hypothetical protein